MYPQNIASWRLTQYPLWRGWSSSSPPAPAPGGRLLSSSVVSPYCHKKLWIWAEYIYIYPGLLIMESWHHFKLKKKTNKTRFIEVRYISTPCEPVLTVLLQAFTESWPDQRTDRLHNSPATFYWPSTIWATSKSKTKGKRRLNGKPMEGKIFKRQNTGDVEY